MGPTIFDFAIVGMNVAGVASFIYAIENLDIKSIALIDPLGVGQAESFNTVHETLVCNTTVETMSIRWDNRLDFLTYLNDNGISATTNSFISRKIFAQYLRDRYKKAFAKAMAKGLIVTQVFRKVIDIDLEHQDGYVIQFDRERPIQAKGIVIGTGR